MTSEPSDDAAAPSTQATPPPPPDPRPVDGDTGPDEPEPRQEPFAFSVTAHRENGPGGDPVALRFVLTNNGDADVRFAARGDGMCQRVFNANVTAPDGESFDLTWPDDDCPGPVTLAPGESLTGSAVFHGEPSRGGVVMARPYERGTYTAAAVVKWFDRVENEGSTTLHLRRAIAENTFQWGGTT